MNQLKPFLKKFLIIYAFAVGIVLIYFIIKILFTEPKEIELKSFDRPVQTDLVEIIKEDKEDIKEQSSKTGFILLPRK